MKCHGSHFGAADDKVKYYFHFDGRRDRVNGARASSPVRGKRINLGTPIRATLHVPDIPAALYA